MKNILRFLLILALCVGIGFLCYYIFGKVKIEKVEIDGKMQTLYIANSREPNNPNYQDAKLKITYKDGNIKYIPLGEANINLSDFSTSSEKFDGKMRIEYKSYLFDINYSVIKNGYYYVTKTNTYVSGNLTNSNDSAYEDATEFFTLTKDGNLKYYKLVDGVYKSVKK